MKLREKAYAHFTEHLLAETITPGQFISQRELVELTGLTLGAIRELIPRLEADGLIVTVPQRGMQVAHIDLDLVRNTFQLRLILEKEAIAFFTEHAPIDLIERLAAEHERICNAITDDVSADLLDEAQMVDWNLHDVMIDFLDNSIISDIYRVNSIKIRLINQKRTRLTPTNLKPVMEEHLRIIDTIRRRDTPAAITAITGHIKGARNRAMHL